MRMEWRTGTAQHVHSLLIRKNQVHFHDPWGKRMGQNFLGQLLSPSESLLAWGEELFCSLVGLQGFYSVDVLRKLRFPAQQNFLLLNVFQHLQTKQRRQGSGANPFTPPISPSSASSRFRICWVTSQDAAEWAESQKDKGKSHLQFFQSRKVR